MPSVDHPLGWCHRAMTSTHRRGMCRTKVDAHQTELTEHAASGTLGTRTRGQETACHPQIRGGGAYAPPARDRDDSGPTTRELPGYAHFRGGPRGDARVLQRTGRAHSRATF